MYIVLLKYVLLTVSNRKGHPAVSITTKDSLFGDRIQPEVTSEKNAVETK